jgi:hypothetical protein
VLLPSLKFGTIREDIRKAKKFVATLIVNIDPPSLSG